MRDESINHAFLDGVLAGEYPDVYYHFGVASGDGLMDALRDVRAIILAGSGDRIVEFAQRWSALHDGAPIVALPKEERFVTRYCAGVLFASHGMGMPSASIAVQELLRMLYFLKGGDHDAMADVFWARVGTSGGVGLPGGTVVVTTEGVMADLRPYRLLQGGSGEYWFDGTFPADVADAVVAASAGRGIPVEQGRTVAGNEFFLEQFRLDGAICMETPESKTAWLEWIHAQGVRNIEMEGAMLAGYLNHWGFPKFAMICATLLDRLQGDQVTASKEELHLFSERSGDVLFHYLTTTLG
ncbi:MAG: uridine phosphorylase [Candidatus Nanopelagicales bacterium]|jgi:uridine phosphorylase|nr:uridine phosphorylase [Candidatus Nanopelagicales bacterium]